MGPFAQGVDDVEGIDSDHGTVAGDLDHNVELGCLVIQNAEPDAGIVQWAATLSRPRTDRALRWDDCGAGSRLAPRRPGSARTASTVPRAATRAPVMTPSRSTWATEGHLPAPRGGDFAREIGPDTRGYTLAQVFSSFFLAAGKRTLFKISRYPGECG